MQLTDFDVLITNIINYDTISCGQQTIFKHCLHFTQCCKNNVINFHKMKTKVATLNSDFVTCHVSLLRLCTNKIDCVCKIM